MYNVSNNYDDTKSAWLVAHSRVSLFIFLPPEAIIDYAKNDINCSQCHPLTGSPPAWNGNKAVVNWLKIYRALNGM